MKSYRKLAMVISLLALAVLMQGCPPEQRRYEIYVDDRGVVTRIINAWDYDISSRQLPTNETDPHTGQTRWMRVTVGEYLPANFESRLYEPEAVKIFRQ